jgi:DNA ligase-1
MYTIEEVKPIFDKLQSINSKKDKERILKENQSNELFTDILKFLLDSHIITGLSEKKINKNIGVLSNINYSEKLNNGYPTTDIRNLFEYIKKNNTGKDIDISVCESYITNFNTNIQDFIKSILTKSLKIGIDTKTVNKVYGKNFIPTWEVQQAYSIDKYPLKKGEWFSLSEKLNGNRGTYYKGKIISRQGKEFTGLDHIINDIKVLLGDKADSIVLDGELRRKNIDGISDNENFRIGTGILNSDDADKSCINFTMYDVLSVEEFDKGIGTIKYRKRREILDNMRNTIQEKHLNNIAIVDMFYEGTDQTQITKYLDKMVSEDKEGCMLDKDVVYKCKRHSGILKVKRFYTCDLKIIRLEEGSGRLSGTLGAFVVDYKDNELNVGSGMSDEQRTEFWNKRDELVGRVIEVKYKEESNDKTTGNVSLQFPIFISLREVGKEVSYS